MGRVFGQGRQRWCELQCIWLGFEAWEGMRRGDTRHHGRRTLCCTKNRRYWEEPGRSKTAMASQRCNYGQETQFVVKLLSASIH